jgi:anti-sigma factor RsiW
MADLTCQEVVELVTAYLDDALDEDTAQRVEQHVALCPGCETYVEQIRVTVSLVGELPVEALSEEAQATLLEAFRDFPR